MAFNEEKNRRMTLRRATGSRAIQSPKPVRSGANYAMAFACLNCRTSNKRSFNSAPCDYPKTIPCPICAQKTFNLGRNFKAPRKNDLSQWKKIAYLIEHGFIFQKIRTDKNSFNSIPYPKTLAEAKVFVKKYRAHAIIWNHYITSSKTTIRYAHSDASLTRPF